MKLLVLVDSMKGTYALDLYTAEVQGSSGPMHTMPMDHSYIDSWGWVMVHNWLQSPATDTVHEEVWEKLSSVSQEAVIWQIYDKGNLVDKPMIYIYMHVCASHASVVIPHPQKVSYKCQ